ncbi:CARDB domain-containing protein [Natronomonas marina]|jgi:hypothetical protein|uniref:CARDB domain-containing protein n=1 Tax=Natronomonas marina TaxID=2961939 RepID=UPI0020C9A4DF|nr:CARDB domain-containing protein [Natronomonas marina]
MNGRAVLRVALLVVLVATGTAAVAGTAAADGVDVDHTVGMADDPGRVDVTTRVDVPDGTPGLRVTIPERTDVYETEGFTRVNDRTYEWTRSTDEPSLSYTMGGNVTVDRGAGQRHLFAVTDEWAIVRSPRVFLREPGRSVEADQRYAVEGEGAAGPNITYLGPHRERAQTAAGQRFRLVVPEAAEMTASPGAALDSLSAASRRVPFGERDETVFVVVAPTTVEWAATGLQGGDADMWVRDVQRVDTARNAWVHEYVHTRQDYEATEATRWTIEGMAEYYAALLPYEADRIDYGAFREKMQRGTRPEYEDVRLVDPDTWRANEGDYVKGALVFGALDRRLRASEGASMDGVVASFGDREVSQSAFLEAVGETGAPETREDARRYTETTATPQVWNRSAHVAAFGGPLLRGSFEGFAVAGPYRSAGLAAPRVVAGERLEVTVAVRNAGTETGEFDVAFRVDGTRIASRRGTLEPGESTTLSFTRRFEAAGEYELRAGTATATAVVEEPAEPQVTGVSAVPDSAALGERVRLRVDVASGADRPAAGPVTVTAGGRTVTSERVAFAGTTAVTANATFDSPGEHTIRAGERTATVTVRDETPTSGRSTAAESGDGGTGSPPGGGGETTPTRADGSGPGVVVVAAALAGTLALLGRRYP